MLPATFDFGARGLYAQAFEPGPAAQHMHLVGRHASAADGYLAVALVGDESECTVAVGVAFEPELAFVERACGLAELRLVKLRADVMVVEDIVNPLPLEAGGHHVDIVGGIASVDHMESAFLVNLAGQAVFMPQGREILPGVAYGAVALLGEVVTMDMHPLEVFILLVVAFPFGTYHRDGVSLAGKGCRLLPYPGVERHGKVFDYDENLAVHGKNCARPREVTRSRRSERLQSYDIFARIANNPYGRGLGQTAISCRDFHNIGRYRS